MKKLFLMIIDLLFDMWYNSKKQNFKKLLFLTIVTVSVFSGAAYAGTPFDNTVLEIGCENGDIVVSGSFEYTGGEQSSYRVMLATYSDDGKLIKVDTSDINTMADGKNTFSLTADIIDNVQRTKAFVWADGLVPVCPAKEKTIHSLKVLAIGNSFSVDALEWLYGIADNYGIDNIVLGNAYRSGCNLSQHYDNAVNSSNAYIYYKNTTGKWSQAGGKSISYCIKDEDWNLITIQQASGSTGMPDTFDPYIAGLIEYINENKTNPYAKIAWHMTWAYSGDSTKGDYKNYNYNQLTMYNAIVGALKSKVLTHEEIAFFIPAGTAIQNVRTSEIGDTVNRDGYHLDKNLGRYIAGLTWFHQITGLPVDDITFIPNSSEADPIPDSYYPIIKECVKNAVLKPDAITEYKESEQPTEPEEPTEPEAPEQTDEVDLSKYTLLEWEAVPHKFYNSVQSSNLTTSAANGPYYVSSKSLFTREDLPVGTLLVIDEGYQYRPEGWITLDTKNTTSTRPQNVTEHITTVTEEWWGSFTYRGFNIAVEGAKTDITGRTDEVASHFRIYIPKL